MYIYVLFILNSIWAFLILCRWFRLVVMTSSFAASVEFSEVSNIARNCKIHVTYFVNQYFYGVISE